ncbi:unnamed protein product, partial [Prorocentrum cordatum]
CLHSLLMSSAEVCHSKRRPWMRLAQHASNKMRYPQDVELEHPLKPLRTDWCTICNATSEEHAASPQAHEESQYSRANILEASHSSTCPGRFARACQRKRSAHHKKGGWIRRVGRIEEEEEEEGEETTVRRRWMRRMASVWTGRASVLNDPAKTAGQMLPLYGLTTNSIVSSGEATLAGAPEDEAAFGGRNNGITMHV